MARKEKGGRRACIASFVKIQHQDEKVDLGTPQPQYRQTTNLEDVRSQIKISKTGESLFDDPLLTSPPSPALLYYFPLLVCSQAKQRTLYKQVACVKIINCTETVNNPSKIQISKIIHPVSLRP